MIDMVDDATNNTWAELGEEETIWAVADCLRAWIERHGVPLALCVDWKNLYKRPATPGEQLRGAEPITQFRRMGAKLGIEVIAASSPQAEGRVERVHGTHQDRLVKKLRRREIVSHKAANVYMRSEYLPEHNQRFTRAAARAGDYHRRAPRAAELDKIFRLESERTVSEDWVVRCNNRFFQIELQNRNYAPARSKVLVCEGRHGSMAIEYRGRGLRFRKIPAPVKSQAVESARPRVQTALKKPKWKPAANQPWHQAVRRRLQERAAKRMPVTPPLACPYASPKTLRPATDRPRGESSLLEQPDAILFLENGYQKKKTHGSAEPKQKRDTLNEVRMGTF